MSNSHSKLFTDVELVQIQNKVFRNPVWQHPNVMVWDAQGKLGVVNVTEEKGVILVRGNIYTGFDHIKHRHSYWSRMNFFLNQDGTARFDNPSKFHKSSIPLIDYSKIADVLYAEEHLNTEKNKSPDLFEMYSGLVSNVEGGEGLFHMLVYKNTRVVHTIYPQSKRNNETKKRFKPLRYVRGHAKGVIEPNPLVTVIAMPYRNAKGVAKYSVEFQRKYGKGIQALLICDLRNPEVDMVVSRGKILDEFDMNQFELEVEYFPFQDFRGVEKIIKEYDERTYGNSDL